MAKSTTQPALVGQPFRLGADEIGIFESSNTWQVFYLHFPDGARRYTSSTEWRQRAKPIRLDREWNAARPGAVGISSILYLGARVGHPQLGTGYMVACSSTKFEICFERRGPKRFDYPEDWSLFNDVPGIGEPLPPAADVKGNAPVGVAPPPARPAAEPLTTFGLPAKTNSLAKQGSNSAERPPTVSTRRPSDRRPRSSEQIQFPLGGSQQSDKGAYNFANGPRKSASITPSQSAQNQQRKVPSPGTKSTCTCNGKSPLCGFCQQRENRDKRKPSSKAEIQFAAGECRPPKLIVPAKPKSNLHPPDPEPFATLKPIPASEPLSRKKKRRNK
jgi:hypothetical protein